MPKEVSSSKMKAPEITEMPFEVKEKLTGRASLGYSGHFSGNIYNGNADWTVSELIINISEKNWFEKLIKAKENNKPEPRLDKYKVEVVIPPYKNKDFSISVDWPKDEPYEWNIYEARGYKSRAP